MKNNLLVSSIAVLLILVIAVPIMAASPAVSKKVIAGDDGSAVILISVSAGSSTVYGVTVEDPSGSIDDVVAPKGWCSIATGHKAAFRTGEKPIKAGSSVSFRIVTTNKDAELQVTFKDEKTQIGGKKTI
jgi:hypothetical protein